MQKEMKLNPHLMPYPKINLEQTNIYKLKCLERKRKIVMVLVRIRKTSLAGSKVTYSYSLHSKDWSMKFTS